MSTEFASQPADHRTSGPSGTGSDSPVGLRARVTRSVLRMVARRVPVPITLPDGSLLGGPWTVPHTAGGAIVVRRPQEVYRRIGEHPKFGVGESYTAGDWDAAPGTDLADALVPFAEQLSAILPGWLMRLRRVVDRPIPDDQLGSQQHTRANIAAHYDLSNEMFAAFLDPTLSYSSALFDRSRPLDQQDLAQAQLRKIHAALDLADVTEGTDLLEIGTGWGSLAIEAARRGAHVTTITLSVEQAALARQRIEEAGFSDRVQVLVQDYRDVEGTFDSVVSVEMIEAVGERYWPDYFGALSRLLRPGGAISVQAIVMSHERFLATRHSYGWIQKHIFPGGLIPSLQAIEEQSAQAGLQVSATHAFGADYAETLHRWRERFNARWDQIRSESFGEEFRRAWEFYLAYCEAGFRTGYLDVAQIRLEPALRAEAAPTVEPAPAHPEA